MFLAAQDLELDSILVAQGDLDTRLLEVRYLRTAHADDAVARKEPRPPCRAAGDGTCLTDLGNLEGHPDHEQDGEQDEGEERVHDHAGGEDEQARTDALGLQFVGMAIAFPHVLARHLDIPAERNGGEAVFGVSAREFQQRWSEADGEHFRPNTTEARRDEVSPLVDQNEETNAKNSDQ